MKLSRTMAGFVAAMVSAIVAVAAALLDWLTSRRIHPKALVVAYFATNYGLLWLAERSGWIEDALQSPGPILPTQGDVIENVPITWRTPPRLPPQR